MAKLVVIRIRGSVNVNRDIEHTLGMLKLKKVNNAVLIDDRPTYMGMLQKVKDYVTWGEVDTDDVALILGSRGEIAEIGKLTDDYIKSKTGFKGIADFAKAFTEDKASLDQIPDLKSVYRLHPPRKGHAGIKRAFSIGGSLGNRGKEIKKLLYRMR